jgi:hypothetical protein
MIQKNWGKSHKIFLNLNPKNFQKNREPPNTSNFLYIIIYLKT